MSQWIWTHPVEQIERLQPRLGPRPDLQPLRLVDAGKRKQTLRQIGEQLAVASDDIAGIVGELDELIEKYVPVT